MNRTSKQIKAELDQTTERLNELNELHEGISEM